MDAEANTYELTRFRGDHDVRLWPDRLLKLGSQSVHWAADYEELEHLADLFRVSEEAMNEESVTF